MLGLENLIHRLKVRFGECVSPHELFFECAKDPEAWLTISPAVSAPDIMTFTDRLGLTLLYNQAEPGRSVAAFDERECRLQNGNTPLNVRLLKASDHVFIATLRGMRTAMNIAVKYNPAIPAYQVDDIFIVDGDLDWHVDCSNEEEAENIVNWMLDLFVDAALAIGQNWNDHDREVVLSQQLKKAYDEIQEMDVQRAASQDHERRNE